jgi:hypothetical protein
MHRWSNKDVEPQAGRHTVRSHRQLFILLPIAFRRDSTIRLGQFRTTYMDLLSFSRQICNASSSLWLPPILVAGTVYIRRHPKSTLASFGDEGAWPIRFFVLRLLQTRLETGEAPSILLEDW